MKKGFIHIIEIIIVVMAMFVVLIQLVNTPHIDTDWSVVSVSAKINDLLYAMDASGIDWFNGNEVNRVINSSLNMSNAIYSVRLNNVIKPVIFVGCVCFNTGELDELTRALKDPANPFSQFSINGQSPTFDVRNITNMSEGHPEMSWNFDVIVVRDQNISYKKSRSYLANGGGIVEIRDLDVGLAGENGGNMRQVHYNLFGLEYEIGVLPTTGDYLYFTNSAKRPEGRFYNVYKYFHHIPNSTGMKINQTHNFTNTLDGMIDYERINVSVYSPAAEAALRQEGTNAPALILNAFMADGKGRTAWMSAPESGRPLTEDDVAVLVKSLVIWASGESYDVVPGIAASNPSRAVLYKVYNRDMVQPVEVSLSVGSIY